MGRVENKVAFITGAARGQGRSHAVRLAEEGADIIAVDICAPVATVQYPLATEDDLALTVKAVEATGQRIVASVGDIRDLAAMRAAVDAGVAELGRLDIVCCNAGVLSYGQLADLDEATFDEMIAINLSGQWRAAKAAIPHLLKNGSAGGSIIFTSSSAGLAGVPNAGHYAAAKHGLVGLARTLANELASHMIRVNTIHPTTANTEMINNKQTYDLFGVSDQAEFEKISATMSMLPRPWVEASDISNAVLFLASDEARYITGAALPVDLGVTQKF